MPRQFDQSSIKRLRKSKGMKIREFARFLRVSPTHICNLEEGFNKPTLKTLENIMAKCEVDETYFFKGESNSNMIIKSSPSSVPQDAAA